MARVAIDERELLKLDNEPLVTLVINTPRACGLCEEDALIVNGDEAWCSNHWLIRCGAIEMGLCPCDGCRTILFWGGRHDVGPR